MPLCSAFIKSWSIMNITCPSGTSGGPSVARAYDLPDAAYSQLLRFDRNDDDNQWMWKCLAYCVARAVLGKT